MLSNDNQLEVGVVVGFHGLRGEMKVKPYSDNPERFYDFDQVILDGKIYKIERVRTHKGAVYITLESINSRTKAEQYKNKVLKIDREDDVELEEDEFYIVDLIGFPVIDKGKEIGKIKDVLQTSGPVDNFVIKIKGKTIYVPALKEIFEVDLENKNILADIPEEYFEL